MRQVISGLGGLLLVFAVGVGATVAHLETGPSPSLTKTANVVAANVVPDNLPYPSYRKVRPSPSSSPTPAPVPVPVAAAPVAHAAPAAPPAAAAPRRVAPAAPARIVIGSTQQALINQDRARYGLAPLTWNSCLASVAASNAARMARAEVMSHANGVYQDLACGIGHQSGENVGWWSGGVNDGQLNTMFMNSAEHRANILGPYHYVATAWRVAANGVAYIAVEFD